MPVHPGKLREVPWPLERSRNVELERDAGRRGVDIRNACYRRAPDEFFDIIAGEVFG